MKALIRTELSKALKNKYFLITLIAASVIAVLSAMNQINVYNSIYKYLLADKEANGGVCFKNPWLPSDTLYTYWIGADYSSLYFSLFFLLLPLFAAFPYGWSYYMEMKKGYVKNVVTRTKKSKYFLAKYAAVFTAGGLAVMIPLLVNFCSVACFVPARTPNVLYDAYNGVVFPQMWSRLFYTHPLVYVELYMLLNFVFGGLIAALSLVTGFLFKNRVAVVITPFLLMLGMNFVNTYSNKWELSPLNFLHSGTIYNIPNGWIVLSKAIVLFAVTFGITVWRGQKNEVF